MRFEVSSIPLFLYAHQNSGNIAEIRTPQIFSCKMKGLGNSLCTYLELPHNIEYLAKQEILGPSCKYRVTIGLVHTGCVFSKRFIFILLSSTICINFIFTWIFYFHIDKRIAHETNWK